MSFKDYLELRSYMVNHPTRTPQERQYFAALEARLRLNNIWPTTTTTA